MNLKMEQFEIQNAHIKYIDESSGLSNILEDFNFLSLAILAPNKQTWTFQWILLRQALSWII